MSPFEDFPYRILKSYLLFVLKVSGGREGRPIGAYELAKAVEELGAGEILLNCIDCDGKVYFLLACLYKALICEIENQWHVRFLIPPT